MATNEEVLQAVDEVVSDGVRRGLLHDHVEDDVLDGRSITVDGRRLVNFGSCSYLGLETDPRLKAAVHDAVERFGTQFSSSRAYASAPQYRLAEEELTALFGRPTIITPSTTMGHVAAMPTLIGGRDLLLLDHQVHHSVHTAARLVQAGGATVELVPHSDLRSLERRLQQAGGTHRRVWYAADGLYSMYADFLPAAALDELAQRYDNLWLYIDDAHSFSWTGRDGRGHALDQLAPRTLERTVVAGSLNKSFAAAGGALTFPDAELCRRVRTVGGPLIFSGPVQPPMLGAILATARLHRTGEIAGRQQLLLDRIRLFNRLAAQAGLPVVSESEAPIRYVGAGVASVAYRLTARLRAAGWFVNTATFPAVPAKRCGARLTINAHHTPEDITGVVRALAEHLPAALAEEGATVEDLRRAFARQLRNRREVLPVGDARPAAGSPVPRPRTAELRLEHHRSVDTIEPGLWDRLLGRSGFLSTGALRGLEAAFDAGGVGGAGQSEDCWDFHYWIVRESSGRPIAATFFTTALWKDDMLSPVHVSREVERRRTESADPHLLTSTMIGMGSLLTQGDHLWLDRSADWRGALRHLLQAAREVEDATGAAGVVLRDLPDGDDELHTFLLGEGFLRIPMWNTWVRDVDFIDDEGFLAGLDRKKRQHQRRVVLPWEGRYQVEVLEGGTEEAAAVSSAARDHLYEMYRGVHARRLDLNVFALPRRIIDVALDFPGWETLVLRLPGESDTAVAFGTLLVTEEEVSTVFLGLDPRYVASHHSYQQLLFQALRRARQRGATRVQFGMTADLQKSRFGARPERRWAYVQATETFNADVLAHLAETARTD